MTILSNSEKRAVVESRIKSLNHVKFNLEIDLIVENAKTQTNAESIASLNAAQTSVNAQIAALTTEAAKYPEEQA
jgi:hypothetical protein